ncbi:MAG: hypothetical protein GEV07_08615 [Streptosporangiales bacterium]|nr:hypothetical protein [Streptosporangiales bacterium]
MRALTRTTAISLVAFLLALAAATGIATAQAQPADAATDIGKITAAWDAGKPVYQDPSAGVLSADDVEGLTAQVQDDATGTPIFVAVLPQDEVDNGGKKLVQRLAEKHGGPGTYITLGENTIHSYSTEVPDRIDALTESAMNEGDGDPQSIASLLIDKVAEAAASAEQNDQQDSGAGVGSVMLVGLGLLLLIAFAGGLVAVSSRRKRQQREAEQFAAVHDTAEEDVTKLGEDIAELDLDVQGADLDPAARTNYENALDAYDRSKDALVAARRPDDLRRVTEALDDGRYEMTCVRARLTGEPVPARRAPCFFNPQHGPSAADRPWTPPGGSVRDVPVCAADASIMDHGHEPAARHVMVDGVRRPYWEGGPAYAPWYGGYYGAYGVDGLLTGMLLGSVLAGGWGGFGDFGGGDSGGFGGGDSGGFGGGDSGGFGGGDFGGFGGGDFGGFGGGDF